jgi:hypothetical protein
MFPRPYPHMIKGRSSLKYKTCNKWLDGFKVDFPYMVKYKDIPAMGKVRDILLFTNFTPDNCRKS